MIITPDFDATAAALDAAGLAFRRVRQAGDRRQGFRRLGPAIMEIVEAPEADAAALLGADHRSWPISRCRPRTHDGHLSDDRPAVQPGRQIATLGRGAGLSTRLALMDPE